MTVAIVTDSGSDLTPEQLKEHGIRQVPLTVTIGDESFLVPDQLTPDDFYRRLTSPGTPFPTTAAPSAGGFKQAFEEALKRGDDIVYAGLSETLSATLHSGEMAKEILAVSNIHIVDSHSASMGVGFLALYGAAMAKAGKPAEEIAAALTGLRDRTKFYVALETLEYLKRGGRISGARAAIGGLLSVKPIMTIEDGVVVPIDQPRTRARARERLLELMSARPVDAVAILYTPPFDADAFCSELVARLPEPKPDLVTAQIIGPVIGTHVGPGAYGGVLLYRE